MRPELVNKIRATYHQSWAGRPATLTNGLLAVIFAALVSLGVALPYWAREESSANQRRDLEAQLIVDYLDCVRGAEAGATIKAVSLEGVRHAESTAAFAVAVEAWMQSVVKILHSAAPGSAAVAAIEAETNAFGPAVDNYVQEVAEFRVTTEAYQPPSRARCESLPGAGLVDPPGVAPGG